MTSAVAGVGVVLVAGAAGAATSFLQTVLPDAVGSLANSGGSWCLVAWLLARRGPSPARGAAAAVAALLALVAGYYVTADLRGFGLSPASIAFWVVVAALVGPPLGAGAVWSRTAPGRRRVLGALVLPSLLAAESAYGVVLLGSSTSTAYWVGEGVVAVALGAGLVVPRPVPAATHEPSPGHDRVAVRCQRSPRLHRNT